jgi:hypothetical protein
MNDDVISNFLVQKRLTRTLLHFCETHNYPSDGLSEIRECLTSLENGDREASVRAYLKVPLGGRMGYFDEWIPRVVYAHETPEALLVMFETLLAQWKTVMDRLSQ